MFVVGFYHLTTTTTTTFIELVHCNFAIIILRIKYLCVCRLAVDFNGWFSQILAFLGDVYYIYSILYSRCACVFVYILVCQRVTRVVYIELHVI